MFLMFPCQNARKLRYLWREANVLLVFFMCVVGWQLVGVMGWVMGCVMVLWVVATRTTSALGCFLEELLSAAFEEIEQTGRSRIGCTQGSDQ